MQVFKLYFRILSKHIVVISVYLSIFFGLSLMFTLLPSASSASVFIPEKTRIAVFNEDEGAFAKALIAHISERTAPVQISDTKESIEDALFFRDVEYILRIPRGFSESFLKKDNKVQLEKSAVPLSASEVHVDFLLNRYLRFASIYHGLLADISSEQAAAYIEEDFKVEAKTTILDSILLVEKSGSRSFFFLYYSYSVMAIILLSVTTGMLALENRNIKMRNLASPLRTVSLNLQVVLGNLVFAVAVWALSCGLGLILEKGGMNGRINMLLMANALCYTFVCLGLGFFVGHAIKSQNAIHGAVNVVSLGMSFISGVFVPKELLGETIKRIASFTPTYWYVEAVNSISTLTNNSSTLDILNSMLIQLGFAAAFLALGLAVARHKSLANEA